MTHTAEGARRCGICGTTATRVIQTAGLRATGQTLYCDRHAAELLARAGRAIPSGRDDAWHCYPCSRGDHAEHKENAWEPDVPCQCPRCTTRDISPEPCIAPPGNLCTDTGCWDADRCIVTPRHSSGGSDA